MRIRIATSMLVFLIAAPALTDLHAAADPKVDRSGKARKGEASYYAKKFTDRKTASGERFDPRSNTAASKTLPLGTKAKVTNLENGKSTVVEITDRGPFVDGRIVDLTPKSAEKLDMKEDGTAPVVVKPLVLPKGEPKDKPTDGPAKDKKSS
ncbi:MAG TPA: septal ring lytic transglycosylase RlpA family protein [Burkholderiaceae bacterium]